MSESRRGGQPLVQIVGPTDDWVLERLARTLATKLPYATFSPWKPRPGEGALAYYVNYALFDGPSGLIDVGFFTHREDGFGFLERASVVDCCVCMARLYADWLRGQGVKNVAHIPMGFDSYRYRPTLVLGVVGRLESARKGRHLVEEVRKLPFVEVVATEGRLPEAELRGFYQRVDYVLVPATVEGGPMCLLEGLAMGKPVIVPAGVGMEPEFAAADQILRSPAGAAAALVAVVKACFAEKRRLADVVRGRSWDSWAEGHHRLFMRLLRERGVAVPRPGPGFRFGMMGELDVPPGVDAAPLEAAVDRAAAHLFHGRPREARNELETVAPLYPCVTRLIDTFPAC